MEISLLEDCKPCSQAFVKGKKSDNLPKKASRRFVTGKAYVKGSCFLTATCFGDLFQKDLKPLSQVP